MSYKSIVGDRWIILVVGKAASSVDYYCFIVLSQNMHEGWVEQNKKLYLDNCLWNAPNSQNNTLISTPPYKYSLPSNAMNWNLLHKMQFDYIWFLNALNWSVWISDRMGNKSNVKCFLLFQPIKAIART